MKKLFIVVLLSFPASVLFAQEKDLAYYISHAPFKMPEVTTPSFPAKNFSIPDYGAVGDGQTMNTKAFVAAITACDKAGGGTVIIPAGVWLTGPIELKSNVNLHAERGALVLFTPDHTQFPLIRPKGNGAFMVQPPL